MGGKPWSKTPSLAGKGNDRRGGPAPVVQNPRSSHTAATPRLGSGLALRRLRA